MDIVPVLGSPAPSKTNFSPDILMFDVGGYLASSELETTAVLCSVSVLYSMYSRTRDNI